MWKAPEYSCDLCNSTTHTQRSIVAGFRWEKLKIESRKSSKARNVIKSIELFNSWPHQLRNLQFNCNTYFIYIQLKKAVPFSSFTSYKDRSRWPQQSQDPNIHYSDSVRAKLSPCYTKCLSVGLQYIFSGSLFLHCYSGHSRNRTKSILKFCTVCIWSIFYELLYNIVVVTNIRD